MKLPLCCPSRQGRFNSFQISRAHVSAWSGKQLCLTTAKHSNGNSRACTRASKTSTGRTQTSSSGLPGLCSAKEAKGGPGWVLHRLPACQQRPGALLGPGNSHGNVCMVLRELQSGDPNPHLGQRVELLCQPQPTVPAVPWSPAAGPSHPVAPSCSHPAQDRQKP